MSATADLNKLARLHEVEVEINKGRSRDVRGEVVLSSPVGKSFKGGGLHTLFTEQQNAKVGDGLETWELTVLEAHKDLRNNVPLEECPADCDCREESE